MKKTTVLLVILSAAFCNAQSIKPQSNIKLASTLKKQSNTVTTSAIRVSGQILNMSSNNTSELEYSILKKNGDSAVVEMKLQKFKTSNESMGNKTSYNSEDLLNGNTEASQQLDGLIGSITKLTINKQAVITNVEQSKKAADLLKGNSSLMSGILKGTTLDIFFIVKNDKNIGDTWVDSTITESNKTIDTFTYKTLDKNIATIEVKSSLAMKQEMQQMGMTMQSNFIGTVNSIIQIDVTTLLVKKKTSTSNLTGTMNTKDMEIPLTTTITTTDIIE